MIKKIFFFFFALSIISCSTNDDVLEEQNNVQQEDLQPEKILPPYVYPTTSFTIGGYFKCVYNNGKLTRMYGRYLKSEQLGVPDRFDLDSFMTFTYNNNQVKLEFISDSGVDLGMVIIYTMENDRLIKSELYYRDFVEPDMLVKTRTYTYEANKIAVYEDENNKMRESFITYTFDSNKNLIKSEKLDKSYGIDSKLTVTNYSNFDHAKNPFKKLSLVYDQNNIHDNTFYVKSLSANNYRKIEGTTQLLNSQHPYPQGTFMSQWNYNYDSQGQVVLYHPLQ
ncbi:hypothetical protein [Chryseobacterium sp. JUb7]|uniref:hypothetical protein n=1 Tax=Chryseobacterium sp. JUb7 TaxID=2940599 RepID=UPI0021686129|nr:hypothetical protein [Chryseobacterium sp. JUb7]MCS3532592.1 hypothetical protein [Chryseobacterium sp. JUb7]